MTKAMELQAATHERLSAVMDGESDPETVMSVCESWKHAGSDREAWHVWHLIGDVMRSDDLVSDASRDRRFLMDLRDRLANEPVVLAPSLRPAGVSSSTGISVAQRRRGRAWTASAAIAAGFVAVAGATLVMQRPAPDNTRVLAGGVPDASNIRPVSVEKSEAPAVVVSGQMIRDARLQQYLAAHKQFGGAGALGGLPSGFLRSATVESPSR